MSCKKADKSRCDKCGGCECNQPLSKCLVKDGAVLGGSESSSNLKMKLFENFILVMSYIR